MEIGKKLIELRKQKNMTQEDVAEHLGVTRQTISNWELGTTKPDIAQVKAISSLYQISVDELIDNDIQNIIVKRISNTEKLAGLVYRILKWIIIIFISFFILMILMAILGFIFFGVRHVSSDGMHLKTEISMRCNLDNKEYDIWLIQESNNPVIFRGMPELLEHIYLPEILTIQEAHQEIVQYFEYRNGYCQ